MKILHIIPSLEKGGAERYCADVCAELSKREGIEVMLLNMSSVNKYGFITDDLNYQACHSKVLPSITGKSIIDTKEYESIIKDFKPDIIHSHLFWAELLSRELYDEHIKYVTHCHNNMPEFDNFRWSDFFHKAAWTKRWEKKWILRRYRRCQNYFLVNSKDTLAFYQHVLPKDLQRIKLIHPAINFKRFNKANHDRTSSLNSIRLISVGRFVSYKNQGFLVDVVELLKSRNQDVKLQFLGNGEMLNEVKQKVKDKNVENEIQFEGVVDEVEAYLNQANLYVHPAYYEPFGLVLLEAMAAGLPVVCLDGKGNRDLIEQGKNGFMIHEQSPEIFADKVMDLYANSELYRSLAYHSVEFARRFDISKHTDEIINYYLSL